MLMPNIGVTAGSSFKRVVVKEVKQRKQFFFEKKNQKTFPCLACATGERQGSKWEDVFWFFFSKKNVFLPLLACLSLTNCGSLLTESTSTAAGIAGAGIAGSITHNAAVATGIGLGVQAVAIAGLQYAERRVHAVEQATIARAAGPLNQGDTGAWSVTHDVPIEPPEHGSVMVTRDFGAASFHCKEIVFSVDHEVARDFYLADVCQDGETWRWASAEPATARWGNLQ